MTTVRPLLRLTSLLAVAALGCRITDVRLWQPAAAPRQCVYEFERRLGVAYREPADAHDDRNRLDLYLPQGAPDGPTVVLVHGGGWVIGDNRCCGLYSSVGEFLARQGVAVAMPNYRLSPGVKHPEHVRDVARAVAWVRRHVARGPIYLVGHSAGGHLVTLLASDERYLNEQGLSTADVAGVVAISGVYRIPPGGLPFTLGGTGRDAFALDEVAPVRGGSAWGLSRCLGSRGLPMTLDPFGPAFGDDPQVRRDASPLTHARPGLPPFLLVSADNDLPALPAMAEEFRDALAANGVPVRLLCVPGRNHSSVVFRAVGRGDPVADAMLDFIRTGSR